MNIINRIDDFFRYHLQQVIQRVFPPRDCGVFVFHEVVDDLDRAIIKEYAIRTNEFIDFIDGLRDKNVEFGRFDADNLECRKVYVTFDDGFESLLYSAIPILEERKINYLVFIPISFIGKKGYLTKKQLLNVNNMPNAMVGGHAHEHCVIHRLDNKRIYEEVVASKTELEDVLKTNVEYFAFPYGSLNAVGGAGIRSAKKAGYKYAFSTLCVNNKLFFGRYFYPRITVTSTNYLQILNRF